MNLFTKDNLQTYKANMITGRGEGREINWEYGTNKYILLYM